MQRIIRCNGMGMGGIGRCLLRMYCSVFFFGFQITCILTHRLRRNQRVGLHFRSKGLQNFVDNQHCLVLSCLVLSCLVVFSCLLLSSRLLSSLFFSSLLFFFLFFSFLFFSFLLFSSRLVSSLLFSCRVVSCHVVSYRVLSCLVWSCLVVSCLCLCLRLVFVFPCLVIASSALLLDSCTVSFLRIDRLLRQTKVALNTQTPSLSDVFLSFCFVLTMSHWT
jgi:hypothetical protein